MNRPDSVLPVMRKEFGLVGRHVHIDWTIPLAAFARQAKVQSFFHVLIAPSITNDIAMQHFPKQVRAATRRMHLFAGDHITRTHCVLSAFAIFAAALSNPNAAQRGMGEAAVIIRELEVCGWVPGMVVRSQSQVLIDVIRINKFSWIHLPIGVPNSLEFPKSLDQLRSKHLVEEFCFRLSVPMFARD